MSVVKVDLRLVNRSGLHARPAALFVQKAREFKSRIVIQCRGKIADAKNILQVLALGADYGDVISITAEGEDAEKAIQELTRLINEGLGEGRVEPNNIHSAES